MVTLPTNEWPALSSEPTKKPAFQSSVASIARYAPKGSTSNTPQPMTSWQSSGDPRLQHQTNNMLFAPSHIHQSLANTPNLHQQQQQQQQPSPGLRYPLQQYPVRPHLQQMPNAPQMYNTTPTNLRPQQQQQYQFSIPIQNLNPLHNGTMMTYIPENMYLPEYPLYGNGYPSTQYAMNGAPLAPRMQHNQMQPVLRPPPGLAPPQNAPNTKSASIPPVFGSVPHIVCAPSPAPTSSDGSGAITDTHSRSLSTASTRTSPRVKEDIIEEVKTTAEGPLDRYAATYVPTWLREVNEDPQFSLIPLPEEPNYDYDAFVSCFLPRKLVFSDPDEDEGANLETKVDAGQSASKDDVTKDDELVPVDSTWLKGDDAGLGGELESIQKDAGEVAEVALQSAHASVGAHSQAQDSDVEFAGPIMQRKIPETRPTAALPIFTPKTYAERFRKLLELEFAHRREVLAAQSLFNIQLSVFPEMEGSTTAWSKEHLYSFKLPGVREDYPNLVTGDLLQLRVLASHSKSWLRLAFEAKVYVVHKVAGIVIIRCDALANKLESLFTGVQAARFNVLFTSSALRGSIEVFEGVERVGKYLNRQESKTGQILKRWLFPSLSDQDDLSPNNNDRMTNFEWYDDNLNAEQRGVVRNVTSSHCKKIPFLIHGPPGTGKTKTLVETTLQIVRQNSHSRILLTAPSVTAADTLALRLARHLNPKEMTRINDPRRTFEEVPEALLIYCSIDEGSMKEGSSRFGLPDWEKLIKTKVVIMATHDIHILHLCKVSNLELGRWQGTTIAAMLSEQDVHAARLHWTHLLVDEAGQSSEAEIANALLLVVPSRYHDTDKSLPTVVLCGDVAQLGPQIDSHYARSHGLDVSLLERLSKRKVYHRHLSILRQQARQALLRGDYGPDKLGQDNNNEQSLSTSAAHLVRNYRARNAALLHVVSMLFYDDCLLPCAPHSLLDLSAWSFPNIRVPLLFHHINSKDEWVDEGASFYNVEEIDRVVELCQSLTGKKEATVDTFSVPPSLTALVAAKDIAVITPYREQVWRIRLKLRKVGLAAISVGNVEVYQGAEHKVTIISTVRSTVRFLELDAKRNLGLVFERKRLCVAISRAQEALIVVGNAELLRQDPYWRTFIAYSKRNKTFIGQMEVLHGEGDAGNEDGGDQVGALEFAARLGQSDDTDTAFLAGRMAASALYEEEEEEGDEGDDEG